jgi:hypothetical protein
MAYYDNVWVMEARDLLQIKVNGSVSPFDPPLHKPIQALGYQLKIREPEIFHAYHSGETKALHHLRKRAKLSEAHFPILLSTRPRKLSITRYVYANQAIPFISGPLARSESVAREI